MEKTEMIASEALYSFCGWLTTREEKTVMSANSDSAPIAQLVKEYIDTNKLEAPRENWYK